MNFAFITSIVGILKIAEIVSSFLTWVIASASHGFLQLGLGWVVFTGLLAFVVAIFFFLLYLLDKYPQSFADLRIEGFISVFVAILHFISGIVAAVRASQYTGWGDNEAAASSFFAFLTMVLFIIDAVLFFFMPSTGRPSAAPTTTTSGGVGQPDPNAAGDPNVPPQYASANY